MGIVGERFIVYFSYICQSVKLPEIKRKDTSRCKFGESLINNIVPRAKHILFYILHLQHKKCVLFEHRGLVLASGSEEPFAGSALIVANPTARADSPGFVAIAMMHRNICN